MDILKIVRSTNDFEEMLKILLKADNAEIGADTETSSLKWFAGYVVGHCLSCSIDKQYYGFYIPVRHENDDDMELDVEYVESTLNSTIYSNPSYVKILFNAKFDCNFLANHKCNVVNYEDAMLLMFLRNENEPSHRLKKLAAKYVDPSAGDEEKEVAAYFKKLGDGAHYGMIPVSILGPYGAKDPVITLKLWRFGAKFQAKDLSSKNDGINKEIYRHELCFTGIVTNMERDGVPYDTTIADGIFADIRPASELLAEHIFNIAGRRFNIGSSKEVDSVLTGTFKFDPVKISPRTKEPLWGRGELMSTKSEIGECIAAWRNLDHSISAFDEGIKKYVKDGRIHCSYNQIGTKTGRASASEPNLQQMPKRVPKYSAERVPEFAIRAIERAFELRKAFRAPDGYSIVCIDESQFELRLLNHYANDPAMTQAFTENKDIHTFTASLIFDISYSVLVRQLQEGNPEAKRMRTIAKEVNFAIVYGAGFNRLLQTLTENGVDVSMADVKKFRYNHSSAFSGISSFVNMVQSVVRRRGYVFNYYGRHKRVPVDKAYVGVNYLIQGVTADMLKETAMRNTSLLTERRYNSWLGMMIHDECMFVVKDNEREVIPLLKSNMEDFPWVKCPILAEVTIGPSWGEQKAWHE